MLILGIDTALRTSGYGLIRVNGKRFEPVDCGVIKTPAKHPHSECLRRLQGGIEEIITGFKPAVGVIEGGFFAKNARTAMVLGMARGVVVAVLAKHQIPVYEYAPRKARRVVMGHGGADKETVAAYMAQLLNLDVADIPMDATDALALAICHSLTESTHGGAYLKDPV
jgi:crossover junction endodeoxyribonuclease RuvC